MTEVEKVKNAFLVAQKGYMEAAKNIMEPETFEAVEERLKKPSLKQKLFVALSPMAAEIYRQMNRVMIITLPEGATEEHRRNVAKCLGDKLSGGIAVILPHDYQVIVPEDDSINIEIPAEDSENESA